MDANIYKEKARENLKIAELAFRESCFNASVSRAYYSIFHAAIAILVEQGLLSEKKGFASMGASEFCL
ncbi:HEPN domain-containing protein [candidate division KSB1 bacterium]|nr:HEPN domain-containing protein [candidate division KSB1 bacterium]NIR69493.1 HEPN domain-containing protein [candidate division KSB1 bacterium]NIS22843.1 HEPN domain-containing protein [candidate division KSB1 bacterium]NIT69682.1 HEPN domain-containing protein [candidate division KSB1 bacterium]NIU23352.1 HEPN domain-containing protein [candidate division KSB1 bacterium]